MTSIKRNLEGESMVRVEPSARERRRAEEALHASEERYRRLLELASDAIVLHSDGELVLANEAAARLFGASGPELLLGKPIGDFVAAKDRSAIQKGSRKLAVSSGSTPFVRRKLIRVDGTRFDVEVAASPCSYDDKPAVQLVVRNVAERKQVEHHLSYLAQYDLLTRLPNRTQFRDRLGGALARANRNERLAAVVFLDLDHFQQVNMSLGHEAGDLVLKQVAERLTHSTRKTDTVARLGGDEFSLILEGLTEKQGAEVVAKRVLEALSRPLAIDGKDAQVTASTGISIYTLDADNLDRLWRNADVAMWYAKDCGRNNYQFYSPEIEALSRRDELRRTEMEQRLARLTAREREVLDLLVAGKANKMIAYLLGTSPRTIENQRASIMDKMLADSLPELVRMVLDLHG